VLEMILLLGRALAVAARGRSS